jgi:hypothetical protein
MDDISVLTGGPSTASSLTTATTGVTTTAPGVNLTPTADTIGLTADLNPDPAPPADNSAKATLDRLTFDSGLAGEFSLDIIQHMVKKESVRDNLQNRYDEGRSLRENLKDARRMTGGTLFKVRHIVLDEEVLAMREEKEEEKTNERRQVVTNVITEFNERKHDYDKVFNSPKSPENYNIADLKAIVHFKKRKGDAAVPSLKPLLKQRYDETHERLDLTLVQFLADRGYDGDDVDQIVSEFSLALTS